MTGLAVHVPNSKNWLDPTTQQCNDDFDASLLQLLSHLMTSAALCQTSWLGGCRSWSSAASWAPPPPGCLCLRRTIPKALAAPVPVLLASLATAPAPLTDCPGALRALTAVHS